MNHRGLQRALFRMQHDARFAARLRAGDAAAAASTGLGPHELAWLRAADPAAIAADREGRRAAQLLRNVASELALASAVGPRGDGDRGWLAGFPRSDAFHRAVSEGASLPLALANWATERAAGAPSATFRALLALEVALVHARRAVHEPAPPLAEGAIRRAPGARLLVVPAGTYAVACTLQEAREAKAAGAAPGVPPVDEAARETLLLVAEDGPPPRFGRLRAVRVEPLAPLVAKLLQQAARPLAPSARAAFAARHELDAAEVEAVVDEYVNERVLLRGSAAARRPQQ